MAKPPKVQDIDLGYQAIQDNLEILADSYVLIGFQEGSKTKQQTQGIREKKGNLSMPAIAAENEFGTNKIPARPFMSTSFDENRAQINQIIQHQYALILDGKAQVAKVLGEIGAIMVQLIKRKIMAITFPPNSPRTIAIKKSSKPLIDFGQMIQSVREKVVIK